MALEKPGTSELFRSDVNLNHYRYLAAEADFEQPRRLAGRLREGQIQGQNVSWFYLRGVPHRTTELTRAQAFASTVPRRHRYGFFLEEIWPRPCGLSVPTPALSMR